MQEPFLGRGRPIPDLERQEEHARDQHKSDQSRSADKHHRRFLQVSNGGDPSEECPARAELLCEALLLHLPEALGMVCADTPLKNGDYADRSNQSLLKSKYGRTALALQRMLHL